MAINKIAIVGAGIFGCSIALELDKEGYEVMLFEKENDDEPGLNTIVSSHFI
jgi:glycine/D-amino acid oxidase-like deaminating enzyme